MLCVEGMNARRAPTDNVLFAAEIRDEASCCPHRKKFFEKLDSDIVTYLSSNATIRHLSEVTSLQLDTAAGACLRVSVSRQSEINQFDALSLEI